MVSSENGSQVKSEAIHSVLNGPVSQTVYDKAAHNRMITVHNVSTATEIVVVCIRRKHIVHVIVYSLEGEARSHLISLSGMVEHYIKNDLYAIFL